MYQSLFIPKNVLNREILTFTKNFYKKNFKSCGGPALERESSDDISIGVQRELQCIKVLSNLPLLCWNSSCSINIIYPVPIKASAIVLLLVLVLESLYHSCPGQTYSHPGVTFLSPLFSIGSFPLQSQFRSSCLFVVAYWLSERYLVCLLYGCSSYCLLWLLKLRLLCINIICIRYGYCILIMDCL